MTYSVLHFTGDMRIGGAERAIFQLVRGQRQRGVQSDIAVPKAGHYYAERLQQVCRAQVHSLGQASAFDFRVSRKISVLARDYDVLHFHSPNPVAFLAASRVRNASCVYTHRAGLHSYPLKRRLSYAICGIIGRGFFLTANTRHAACVLAGLFGASVERISVTYNGLDFSLLSSERSVDDVLDELGGRSEPRLWLATTGNLRQCKRVDLILKAVAGMRHRRRLGILIVGDGPELSRLRLAAASLGLGDATRFVGKKECVADYLQVADIFCLPSNQAESFGNSAVEAMGLGIPTLVMQDGGGLVEHICEGAGFVCTDVSDVSRKLDELVGSERRRHEIGRVAAAHVRRKYTVENMLDSYDQVYQRALRK